MRAIVSFAPPGACGTMTVTGLLGYFSCADAENEIERAASSRAAAMPGAVFIGCLRRNGCSRNCHGPDSGNAPFAWEERVGEPSFRDSRSQLLVRCGAAAAHRLRSNRPH